MKRIDKMTCSLVITTYNWKEALELVLKSSMVQSELPDEIIIADDGSKEDTKELIESFSKTSLVPVIHSWQEDSGFRAAASRNRAIAKASGEYIVLIDGDMILHRDFIKDHKKNALKNYFLQGGRVLLTEKKTKNVFEKKQISFSFFEDGVLNRKNAIHCNILSKIFSNKKDTLKGVRSCNISFFKKDCLKVNGFNEEFIGWGREDSEFIVRMLNKGIHRQTIRFNCLAFHIWHNENKRDSLCKNDQILKNAIEKRTHWCKNGINKYIKYTKI